MPDVPVGMWISCGQTEQEMKVQGHSTLHWWNNFWDHLYWRSCHLPWDLDPHDPVDSYISMVQVLGESLLASVLFWHQSTLRWRRQCVSFCCKFCWISSCNPVLCCEFVCMYSRSWVTGKRFWLEGIGVCIRSCSQWRPQVGTVVLPNL
jgi:hypothetical protein